MELDTYSSDSVPCPKPTRSTVMLVCWTGRNASGQWYGGKGRVWNVPGTRSLVPSKGRYLCCTSQMNPKEKDHPNDEKPLGCPLPKRY